MNIYVIVFIIFNINNEVLCQNNKNSIRTINIGFASNLFPESEFRDTKTAIELWSKELINDGYLKYYLDAQIYRNNDEMKNAFLHNKISIGAMHALDYFYIKNDTKIIPLLIPSIKGDVSEKYIILVHKNSKITTFDQLKNKKVAIQKADPSLISFIWFENLVMINESSLIDKFCNVYELKKDSKAIFSVFFNQNDACVVNAKVYYEMCKLNHQLIDDMQIIETSPGFIRDIFCISVNLEKKYISNLMDATISIQNYESGKKIMNLFNFEQFTIFQEKYIVTLKKLLNDNIKYHKKIRK
jgi:ABC-type phosphate/phosphonate transport system substrate-binding protein